MKYSEAGKGSAPRKMTDQEAYAQNHEKIFGAVGPLARKKQEEELKNLAEFSEEHKLYSEFDYIMSEGRKFIRILSSPTGECDGCIAKENRILCESLPECFGVDPIFYIFKEVLDK